MGFPKQCVFYDHQQPPLLIIRVCSLGSHYFVLMKEKEYIRLPVFLNKDTQPAPWQQGRKLTSPHQQDLCTTGGGDKEM